MCMQPTSCFLCRIPKGWHHVGIKTYIEEHNTACEKPAHFFYIHLWFYVENLDHPLFNWHTHPYTKLSSNCRMWLCLRETGKCVCFMCTCVKNVHIFNFFLWAELKYVKLLVIADVSLREKMSNLTWWRELGQKMKDIIRSRNTHADTHWDTFSGCLFPYMGRLILQAWCASTLLCHGYSSLSLLFCVQLPLLCVVVFTLDVLITVWVLRIWMIKVITCLE